jgi:hypothetical protein
MPVKVLKRSPSSAKEAHIYVIHARIIDWGGVNLPETNNGVTSSVIPPITFRATELPNTDGSQGDIAPAREAEQDGVEAHERDAIAGGQPEGEGGEQAHRDGEDHGVEAAEAVSDVAGQPAAEEGTRVDDGEELVGEGGGDVVAERVRGDVGERDEETPFDEEDARRGEGEGWVAEDGEVREHAGAGAGGGPQPGTDE